MAGLFGTIKARRGNFALDPDDLLRSMQHSRRHARCLAAGAGWFSGAVGAEGSLEQFALQHGVTVVLAGNVILRGNAWHDRQSAFSALADLVRSDPARIPDWFAKVDGCFAFALSDPDAGRLLLANDRYGGMPIYIAHSADALRWASEVKGLAHATRAAIDAGALGEFLRDGWVRPPRSYYRSIRQLPARSALLVEQETLASTEIEIYPVARAGSSTISDMNEAKERFAQLVRRAVHARLALAGSGQVVVTLSGGLDSRLLAAEARAHGPIHAVTYGNPLSREVAIAADVARRLDAEHEIVAVDGNNWLSGRDHAVWMTDGMMDISHTHIAHTAPAIEGAGMVLDGLFGDVVLGRGAITVAPDEDDATNRYLRMNRFTYFGPRIEQNFAPVSTPLIDQDLVEFMDSLPVSITAGGRLYREAAGAMHAELFSVVPWLKTGARPYPFRSHRLRGSVSKVRRRAAQLSGWVGVPLAPNDVTMDYFGWYQTPAFRTLYRTLIDGRGAMLRSYLPVPDTDELFFRFPSLHRFKAIGRLLTLEVWLRQAAANRALSWEEMLDNSNAQGNSR